MANDIAAVKTALRSLHLRLIDWLIDDAYPMWSTRGVDPRSGGFIETLDRDGMPSSDARRARVHPRQVYAFAQAKAFGWQGDAEGIVSRGIAFFVSQYRRPDGLFRALVDADHVVRDDRAVLYDQAFALLGFAAAAAALNAVVEYESRAVALLAVIEQKLGAPAGGFFADETLAERWESNPHMHLLEACVAWAEIGADPGWGLRVQRLVELALRRFVRPDSGALGESYLFSGEPTPGAAGRIVEPGHQFEWAWLLLRCEPWLDAPQRRTAFKLIAIGETHGVRDGVAINALLEDFSISDANARFWPQTERLKAALLAAALTDEFQYWAMAHAACASFLQYLDTPVAGLWCDVRLPNGEMVPSFAPASTFYHLVGALVVLHATMRRD